MFKIQQTYSFINEIKKSRFRAIAIPLQSDDAAKGLVKTHADPDANHNCWAWRIGQLYRFSDDGEPSGTAGKPILQAIDGQSLDGVLVIVTRWFGGILLGSGGLVRAYGGTASACLREADKVPVFPTKAFRIECAFGDLGVVEGKLKSVPDIHLTMKNFTSEGAEFFVDVPERESARLADSIRDATSGRAFVKLCE